MLGEGNHNVEHFLDSITGAFFAIDCHWKITYINKAALNYFKKADYACIGQDFRDVFPGIIAIYYNYYRDALVKKEVKKFEAKSLTSDSWFEVHIYPSQEGISVYYYDISDRKQMERSLQYLASIVENSSNAIYSTDLRGRIMTWNPSAERIFGYLTEEVQGKPASLFYPPEITAQFDSLLHKVNHGEYIIQYETIHIKKDGSMVNILATYSPIKDDQYNVIGISSINEDITERKRLEMEMLRLDRLNLVGKMAAGIAHEIRNPLTTVRGFLQLYKNNRRFYKEKEKFDLMIGELDKANAIISELLLLAQNRVVKLKLQNINTIIETIFPLLQGDALLHNMNLKLKLSAVPNIPLDEREIRQLLLNLVRNGIEAMSAEGLLTIGTYQDQGEIVLYVSDEGSGIPAIILKNIGTPFATTKKHGAGLGLATCFSIAESHEGKIDVESSFEGTTVCVRFKI